MTKRKLLPMSPVEDRMSTLAIAGLLVGAVVVVPCLIAFLLGPFRSR